MTRKYPLSCVASDSDAPNADNDNAAETPSHHGPSSLMSVE